MIDQNVGVTEFFIPDFSVSTFFASLGGSLGLWLGVGAVQLCANVASLITHLDLSFGSKQKLIY